MTGHWFNSDTFSWLIVSCDNGSTMRQAARASPPMAWNAVATIVSLRSADAPAGRADVGPPKLLRQSISEAMAVPAHFHRCRLLAACCRRI
jgi:hypothetical protein